ncbi:hypothetical protein Pta02_32980 [Planobispora takensis]|uniref:Uncharacterized protein n=1 Tax=Planobispora takensis TaxID=1367882 RepID=A0A8J3SZP3_9ACTN|nr:hypothetical protein Pta02_32980 [Planobispora takensis]
MVSAVTSADSSQAIAVVAEPAASAVAVLLVKTAAPVAAARSSRIPFFIRSPYLGEKWEK